MSVDLVFRNERGNIVLGGVLIELFEVDHELNYF